MLINEVQFRCHNYFGEVGQKTEFVGKLVLRATLYLLLAHIKTERNYGESVEGGASPRGSRDRGCPAYGF